VTHAHDESEGPEGPALFSPLRLREVESPNRVMVSPMCMYASTDGFADDYHLVHLGRFALGGAGIVVAEATAVSPEGRISHQDLGLWDDAHGEALAPVVRFIAEHGAVPGIQLSHAGRKASAQPAYAGGSPLAEGDPSGEPWPTIGPSAISPGPGWQVPQEMSVADIERSVEEWAEAARRAVEAGFRVIELHGAHGYLLHSFFSPISNQRSDRYGGSFENRMRYPLEVARAVRARIGEGVALLYRISVTDGVEGGLTPEDNARLAVALGEAGVDMIDTSSGGIVTDRSVDTRVRRGYAFHASFSGELRASTGMPVATVGLIVDPQQAEALLASGEADLVVMGRELLDDPNWPHRARRALSAEDWTSWHREAAVHLRGRARVLAQLEADGETPMSRFA